MTNRLIDTNLSDIHSFGLSLIKRLIELNPKLMVKTIEEKKTGNKTKTWIQRWDLKLSVNWIDIENKILHKLDIVSGWDAIWKPKNKFKSNEIFLATLHTKT